MHNLSIEQEASHLSFSFFQFPNSRQRHMTSWAKKKSFIYLIHFQFRFRKQSAPARHNLLHVHGLHHAGIHPLYLPDQGEGPAPEGHTHDLGDGARRQHGHLLLHRRPGRHDSVTNGLLFRIPPSGNRHRTLLSLHRLPQVGQVDWLTATEVNGSIGKYKQVKKMEARLRELSRHLFTGASSSPRVTVPRSATGSACP